MTKRTYIKIGVVTGLILIFGVVAAVQFRGGLDYSTDVAGVRTQFNKDKGKVRLVTLLSPT